MFAETPEENQNDENQHLHASDTESSAASAAESSDEEQLEGTSIFISPISFTVPFNQWCGSGSGSVLAQYSAMSWIRIHNRNTDPDPEAERAAWKCKILQ